MYHVHRTSQRLMGTLPSQTAQLRTAHLPSIRSLQPNRLQYVRCYAGKSIPDKDELNPTSTEYSKSGGDAAAAHSEEAFHPDTTRPESESKGGQSSETLDASPANPEVNKTKQEENTASGRSSSEAGESSYRAATSQRGSPKKQGGGQSG